MCSNGSIFSDTANHEMNVNSKNRFSILAVVTLKKINMRAVDYINLEDMTDSCLILQFVHILTNVGNLQRGDISIVDKCSIHL